MAELLKNTASELPKIYMICLDAYPETNDLIKLMTQRNMYRSELICSGAFTCATMISMISGCIGSEIIDGGIGYNTSYKSNFHTWRKNHCIVERLIENGLDMIIHNHVPWFSRIVGGKPITNEEQQTHYRNHKIQNDDKKDNLQILADDNSPYAIIKKDPQTKITYSSTNPEITLNTFLKWNFPTEKTIFYQNEKKYINHIQKNICFSGLFLTDLCHWHEYIYYPKGQIKSDNIITEDDALNDSIDWLQNWNFDEPNSIFFVFADHSHRVNAYLDPQSYMTWVYYKDNHNPNSRLNPIISSNDFYKLVENKLRLNVLTPTVVKSKWISDPFKTDNDVCRIYAVEDGRSHSIIKDKANAFGRCCNVKDFFLSIIKLTDNTTHPVGIYLFITKLSNKYTFTAYRYDIPIHPSDAINFYKPIDHFSVRCNGPLADRIISRDKIYQLSDNIIIKANELYVTL